MREIPPELDLNLLLGRQVEMVCFAAYSTYLHLDGGVLITIEGPYTHRMHGWDGAVERINAPVANSDLPRLVSNEIVAARAGETAQLFLKFSNGDELTILLADGPYESYQIRIGAKEFVV